ncbi:MAG: cell envelope integrity protein CreD [Treponema sp.]|jgi:inner membrane protein|nr:cell envelope integrity protein CreD [Treponema sp.]
MTVNLLEKFTRSYTFKSILLAVLVLLLLIPLGMIRGLINERRRTAQDAETEIMKAWGGNLIIAGPIVVIHGTRTEEIRTKTEKDGERVEIQKIPFSLAITPKQLDVKAAFKTETRRRGIFSVPLFFGNITLDGDFDTSMAISSLSANENLDFTQAELVISLSGQKGIRKIAQANWKDAPLFFLPGNQGYALFSNYGASGIGKPVAVTEEFGGFGPGVYAILPNFRNETASFTVSIDIQGGQLARFLPVGQDTHISIEADWDAPSFQGAFLPNISNITDKGFSAEWDVSYLSRDVPLFWKTSNGFLAGDYSASLFGVNFFRSIDTYALNARAVKYAILFLMVPFLTLFLLEIFTKKRIHPAPYLFCGVGNAIFYLLLLSLSEQTPFYIAYLLSAVVVTAMMTLYSRSLLPSWDKSWYMGLTVSLSYILLYAVLNAESYALLIGSVGSFAVVALVMFLTRKLNWYGQEE